MIASVVAVLTAAWFVGRARLGARARRVGSVQLRIVNRIAETIGPDLGRAMGAGSLAVVWFGGWYALPLGPVVGWVGRLAWQRKADLRLQRVRDDQIPDAMRAIAAGLRAGGNLHIAIGVAAEELGAPIAGALERCLARCEVGMDLDHALERLGEDLSTSTASRFVETLRVGAVAGAALPVILDCSAHEIEEWARLARDRRAASAQVRISAIVVGAMPFAFLVLAGPAARGPARVLLGQPIGWVLVTLGFGLDALGWAWMRRVSGEGS